MATKTVTVAHNRCPDKDSRQVRISTSAPGPHSFCPWKMQLSLAAGAEAEWGLMTQSLYLAFLSVPDLLQAFLISSPSWWNRYPSMPLSVKTDLDHPCSRGGEHPSRGPYKACHIMVSGPAKATADGTLNSTIWSGQVCKLITLYGL